MSRLLILLGEASLEHPVTTIHRALPSRTNHQGKGLTSSPFRNTHPIPRRAMGRPVNSGWAMSGLTTPGSGVYQPIHPPPNPSRGHPRPRERSSVAWSNEKTTTTALTQPAQTPGFYTRRVLLARLSDTATRRSCSRVVLRIRLPELSTLYRCVAPGCRS